MNTLTAKDAKYGFGRLIDLARAEPVTIAKHGRPVVVVMAVEEYERLTGLVHEDGPALRADADLRKMNAICCSLNFDRFIGALRANHPKIRSSR